MVLVIINYTFACPDDFRRATGSAGSPS